MQLAKVVITSALVLAACAKGLPEGKCYNVFKIYIFLISDILAILMVFAVQFYLLVCLIKKLDTYINNSRVLVAQY